MATSAASQKALQSDIKPYPVNFPFGGIDLTSAFSSQPNRQMPDGSFARTTPMGQNVMGYEPLTGRRRGGQRFGLSRYVNARPSGSSGLIQDLAQLTIVSQPGTTVDPATGQTVQSSQSGRIVKLVSVQNGNVYVSNSGSGSWTPASNQTGFTVPLATGTVIRSDSCNQLQFYADGIHAAYYDPFTNQLETLGVDGGVFPSDSSGNLPRLVQTWHGRLCWGGIVGDPQNWFLSAVGDPFNYNYAPANPSVAQAVAGNASPLGKIQDTLTCFMPFNDDVLLLGCDHSIWQFAGDPANGGQLLLVTNAIGAAFGAPWCMDPTGNLYWVSNKAGIYMYSVAQGGPPLRVSGPIDQLLFPVNTGTTSIRMAWSDRLQGMFVFCSPTTSQTIAGPSQTSHFFYEARTGAWWTVVFASSNFDPLCCCVFDGDTTADRTVLIGSWDGYVRSIDPTSLTDDGLPITSFVLIGPINSPTLDDMVVDEIQAEMGEGWPGSVTYSIYKGTTAEAATQSQPYAQGTWSASRNRTNNIRRAGHSIYVRIDGQTSWAMERLRLTFASKTGPRGRSLN